MAEKSMEERMQRLETAFERLAAVHEIQNLVNTYEFKLPPGLYEDIVKLFAQKTPGVRAELGNRGVYEGIEGIKKLYGPGGVHELMQGTPEKGLTPGILFMQANMTPVIHVAGDGKTAKGLWHTFGPVATPIGEGKAKASWLITKRAYDFVKEDGEWKIWHYHVFNIVWCPFDKSWADVEDPDGVASKSAGSELPDELKPDKPSAYHWTYTPTTAVEYVPRVPEPYETFDETFSY